MSYIIDGSGSFSSKSLNIAEPKEKTGAYRNRILKIILK
jgi:hypothetical protein